MKKRKELERRVNRLKKRAIQAQTSEPPFEWYSDFNRLNLELTDFIERNRALMEIMSDYSKHEALSMLYCVLQHKTACWKAEGKMTGLELRTLRITLGLRQSDLAHSLGVSTKTISRYESGWPIPKVFELAMMLIAAGPEH